MGNFEIFFKNYQGFTNQAIEPQKMLCEQGYGNKTFPTLFHTVKSGNIVRF